MNFTNIFILLGCLASLISASPDLKCQETAKELADKKNPDYKDDEYKKKVTKFFKDCIIEYFSINISDNKEIKDLHKVGVSSEDNYKETIENFFRSSDSFKDIVKDKAMKKSDSDCKNLLYVMAARHVYIIYLLDNIKPCSRQDEAGNILVPSADICYNVPKTVDCTSTDAWLNVYGDNEKASDAIKKFNEHFKKLKCGPKKDKTCDPEEMLGMKDVKRV